MENVLGIEVGERFVNVCQTIGYSNDEECNLYLKKLTVFLACCKNWLKLHESVAQCFIRSNKVMVCLMLLLTNTFQTFYLFFCFPYLLGRELLIGLQDAVFLPSKHSFSTTFLNDRGRGECLYTTTCLKTIVG